MRSHCIPALALLAISLGCHVPARMTASPDGSQAIYGTNLSDRVLLIDARDGKVLRELGAGSGSAVWSRDGQRAWYAVRTTADDPASPELDPALWTAELPGLDLFPAPDPGGIDNVEEPTEQETIHVLEAGQSKPIVTLPGRVWEIIPSADGQWLLISYVADLRHHNDRKTFSVLSAYSAARNKLYPLSAVEGLNLLAAFAPDGDAVFLKPTDAAGTLGVLVSMKLDPDAKPEPTQLALLASASTGYAQRVGDEIWLTTMVLSLPKEMKTLEESPPLHSLYRLNLKDRRLERVRENVGQFFAPSPDGNRVLFESVVIRGEEKERFLSLMDVKTNAVVELRRVSDYPELPMFPCWAGNDDVLFVAEPDKSEPATRDDKQVAVYDVVRYRLEQGKLKFVATLSGGWEKLTKPGHTLKN
jgi:hypothetical protein